jgi:hypothetical protein
MVAHASHFGVTAIVKTTTYRHTQVKAWELRTSGGESEETVSSEVLLSSDL